ncbi:uncharacterized protein [Rutidosis leptorrhynchoides]|uniref:uncharacterized protein n=1 Tax=Rutidosis leptorrhynchoides TaxID=125765 RepID=UPI003A9A158F
MRRSIGPGMGGGGGGSGGGMIKTVHRAVRAGIGGGSEQPFSHSTVTTNTRSSTTTSNSNNQSINNTALFVSSNNNSNNFAPPFYVPVEAPANWGFPADEEFDNWEYIDGSDSESVNGVYDDDNDVFGSVPSKDEVHHAVSSLQEFLEPVSFARLINDQGKYDSYEDGSVETSLGQPASYYKTGSESDWIEPSVQLCNSTSALQVPSLDKVYDAFHLLQTEPSVQRMVISLSSDKAVWDAVMNNEVVRKLRESVNEDKGVTEGADNSVDDSNPVTQVLYWLFANTKDKVIEIVEKITKIVNELVHPMNKDENSVNEGLNSFDKNLRSSFFLTIMVLLIVVVSRSRK